MDKPGARLGADIGGTFTDVVLEVSGRQYSTKVLTTYASPEDAIIEGMLEVCDNAGIAPDGIGQVIHGTTLATNALIERNGAKTAFITTRGFRDVIEMRTESRFEQYDLNMVVPEALLPRQQRYTLNERVGASGEIFIPVCRDELETLIDTIVSEGYQSVAVGFLHSYLNADHEQMVRDVLQRKAPNVMVSLSSDVSPQMREYERFNTVIANAYVKPLMKSYLSRLSDQLRARGVRGTVFLMHSGGGVISLESAAEYPVRLVESGPAGGAVFAANIAASYALDKVLSFDMGGTTAKICLINDQTPKTSRVFEVARTYRFKKGSGMPISIPVIDMVEIGAGGGSLAHVDAMRQIRVGPESAGSEPGPACYGRGGDRPAVTDADLILGRLDPDNFAGGSITLDTAKSIDAITAMIGDELHMNAETAAFGVAEVVDENMANAARVHAVENGQDLSEYTMIAFGGAAPLHASRLCEKLGVKRLLVPQGAGVGSAIGFLRAPFSFEANRSVYMRLSDFDQTLIVEILAQLEKEARAFVRSCDANADIVSEFKVYMRYTGQGWEIPVPLTVSDARSPDPAHYQRLFEQQYERLFGRAVEGMDIEITVWSVNATTPDQAVRSATLSQRGDMAQVSSTRTMFDSALGKTVTASVHTREQLVPGHVVAGPAMITESETTIVVPASRQAIKHDDGCVDITLAGGAAGDARD